MKRKIIIFLLISIGIFIVSGLYFIEKISKESFVGGAKKVTIFFNKAFITLPDGKRLIVDIPKKGMSVAFLPKDNRYPKEVKEDEIKRIKNIKITDDKAIIYLKGGGKENVDIKDKEVFLIIIPLPEG